jgi:hypothetical protein
MEIGARLPGLARQRACQGQPGAARFVDGQIGPKAYRLSWLMKWCAMNAHPKKANGEISPAA